MCFLCVCVCVCIGRYCRSARSCRISCKEHEPPGNAQKHQHWWHQHKSAKFTLLQIVAARSRTCRCQPMFTVMQSVYHNLNSPTFIKTINLQGTVWSDTPCTCAFSFFLCYFSQFEVKVSIYLWMVHSLRLTEGWLMTFSSLESAKVFAWKRIAWQEVTFWGSLTSLFFFQTKRISQVEVKAKIFQIQNWNQFSTVLRDLGYRRLLCWRYAVWQKNIYEMIFLLFVCKVFFKDSPCLTKWCS